MNIPEPKKMALMRILEILHENTDPDHPVTQEEIIRRLRDDYGIELKRKAVGDDLAVLKDAGFDIVSTGSGSYLNSREFEDPELRMLIDGVLASRYIPASYSADLIKKLCRLSSKYFLPHVKNTYSVNEWSKSENPDIFLNIEIADIAIDAGKQVTFTYNKYGADKKLHKTSEHTVSPYQFILRNQRYYLMAYNEKWQNMGFYRLDRITDMRMTRKPATAIRSVKGYESGIDYRAIATSLPYMFTDKPEYVEFLADAGIIDQIVDWFGDNARIEQSGDRVKVGVRVSPMAMEYWAMQYLNSVEILSPAFLRSHILANLEAAREKYVMPKKP